MVNKILYLLQGDYYSMEFYIRLTEFAHNHCSTSKRWIPEKKQNSTIILEGAQRKWQNKLPSDGDDERKNQLEKEKVARA
jgi:hypothetical protein